MSTATISEPISGDKAYQVRARAALPLLVRQAQAGTPVFYSDLAEELGMHNPRNLNYVLGSIGQSLERLSKAWKTKVPPIQCLVVKKSTGLPGEGIGWFLVKKEDFATLPLRQKRNIVEAELQHVFSYHQWQEVLKALELEPTTSDFSPFVSKATGGFGGGESEDHKTLKEYVAQNPKVIGLGASTPVLVSPNIYCRLGTAWTSHLTARKSGWLRRSSPPYRRKVILPGGCFNALSTGRSWKQYCSLNHGHKTLEHYSFWNQSFLSHLFP